METFTNFLVNNYFWFLVITLVLIFALIGYIVDSKKCDNKSKEKKSTTTSNEGININNYEELKNVSLNDAVKKDNKNDFVIGQKPPSTGDMPVLNNNSKTKENDYDELLINDDNPDEKIEFIIDK